MPEPNPGSERRSSAWAAPAVAILIALALGAGVYFSHTRSQLAELRAALRQRGFSLSASELAASGQGPARDLEGFVEAEAELQKLSSLQLPGELHLMNLDSPRGPVPFIKSERPFWGASNLSLTNLTWADLAREMDRVQPVLQKLRTFAHEQIPDHGQGPVKSIFGWINLTFWLSLDALSALQQGSRAAALDDLESLTDLAQIGASEKDFITQIGRAAVIRISLKATWEILQSAEWEEPELRRIEAAWERVRPLQAAEAASEGELVHAGEMPSVVRQELASPWLQNRFAATVAQFENAADERFMLEIHLAYWEAARALQLGRSWRSLQPHLANLESTTNAKFRSPYHHFGLRLCFAKFHQMFEDCAQSEAARQLLLADIALRKFKLRHHGAVPKTLRELSPECLSPASGYDLFGDGDLKYRANPDGTYTLYSVGPNGVDDGGDDLVGGKRQFWESPDLVWPRCR